MDNIITKLGSIINSKNLSEDDLLKYQNILKISYKTDFEILASTSEKSYGLNVLYNGGLKTYMNNTSNSEKGFTTDIGWGCMIRSMQSLVANALRIELLHLDTIVDSTSDGDNKGCELSIARLFRDDPQYPFSIHYITKIGYDYFKVNIGDWFGPSVGAQCMQKIISSQEQLIFDKCCVSVDSGTLYEDELEEYFEKNSSKSVLVLLCVRLGLDKINDGYVSSFYELFDSGNDYKFVGIAGGKPYKSLYFFDKKENFLVYADPHHVSNYLELDNDDKLLLDYKNNYKLGTATIDELDPSMCIGYVIKNAEGLKEMKSRYKNSSIITFKNKQEEQALLNSLDVDDCY